MKIFSLGFPCTGLGSLAEALRILDYSVLHNEKKYENQLQNCPKGSVKELGFLNHYDAVVSPHISMAYPSIDLEFPDSKFIITTRDQRAWLGCMRSRIKAMSKKQWRSNDFKLFNRMKYDWMAFWTAYQEHMDNIIAHFEYEQDRILFLDICGGDKWDKLCNFLDKNVPVNKMFPHENKSYIGGHDNMTNIDKGSLNYIVENFNIKSMLDIGCGPGGMTKLAKEMGLEAVGVDCDSSVDPDICHDFNTQPLKLDKQYDLCWCVEFLEHVEEQYVSNYMAAFMDCKYVFCTAARPNKYGYHHVNCRSIPYWRRTFKKYGFELDTETSEKLKEASTMKRDHVRKTGMFFRNTKWQTEKK
jgi:2-polyprenyl-3-methyl-5-hydroxy-6-metoxy-1,4-benzoquinol methylase